MIVVLSKLIFAQDLAVTNLVVTPQYDHFEISYNLDTQTNHLYQVKLFLRRENLPQFSYEILNAKGDVGEIYLNPGVKKIKWYAAREFLDMNSGVDDYYFEIQVFDLDKGIPWYYYVGGIVLTGGTAAFLFLKGGSEENKTEVKTAEPPGRP